MTKLTFRDASVEDAEVVRAIYAPYVLNTAVTFEYDVPSVEEFQKRIADTRVHFPYILALSDGEVCGYAYAHRLHERKAFDPSVEISIYLEQSCREKGFGSQLYNELEKRLRTAGFASAYALVAATERSHDSYLTDASIRFHTKMGFEIAGRLSHCANKFNLWYDLVYMQKHFIEFPKDC